MATLARQRCLNHDHREAVCRCPSCHNFFCRECVVLFESRLLCALCLAAQAGAQDSEPASRWAAIPRLLFAVLGFLLVWLIFYVAGWTILQSREHAAAARVSKRPLTSALLNPTNSHLQL